MPILLFIIQDEEASESESASEFEASDTDRSQSVISHLIKSNNSIFINNYTTQTEYSDEDSESVYSDEESEEDIDDSEESGEDWDELDRKAKAYDERHGKRKDADAKSAAQRKKARYQSTRYA